MEEEFKVEAPIDIVYTVGCLKSLEVVNFCKDNSIEYNVLEYNVDPKAKQLRAETPHKSTPMVFDKGGWLICNYNTYEKVLGNRGD